MAKRKNKGVGKRKKAQSSDKQPVSDDPQPSQTQPSPQEIPKKVAKETQDNQSKDSKNQKGKTSPASNQPGISQKKEHSPRKKKIVLSVVILCILALVLMNLLIGLDIDFSQDLTFAFDGPMLFTLFIIVLLLVAIGVYAQWKRKHQNVPDPKDKPIMDKHAVSVKKVAKTVKPETTQQKPETDSKSTKAASKEVTDKAPKKKKTPTVFEKEVLEKKKRNLNYLLIFIIAFGLISTIMASFLESTLLIIIGILIMLVAVFFIVKNNYTPKPKEGIAAFNVDEYQDLTVVLNQLAKFNKQKEDLLAQLNLIDGNLAKLEEKRLTLIETDAKSESSSLAQKISVVKTQEHQEEEISPSVVITKKTVKSKEFDTDMDLLLDLVNAKKSVRISDLATFFKMNVHQIESLAKILEEHNLLDIHYPTFGEIELRKKEHGT